MKLPNASTLLFCLAAAACGRGACSTTLPCPLGFAVDLTVTSVDTGAQIANAAVTVSGAELTNMPCAGYCTIPGGAGTYILDVSAPGFATAHDTVQVKSHSVKCGCATVETATVKLALTPTLASDRN